MATTEYGVGHAMAVQKWAPQLMKETLKKTYAFKFMGTDSNNLLQVRNELKDYGYQVTYGLRAQLSGNGVDGDGTLEGNEEALTIYTDSMQVNQLRHAVRTNGRASEQRVPFETRREALDGLSDWWADKIDTAMFNQLAGITGQNTRDTGMNAVTAPDANHQIFAGGEAAEGSLSDTAADQMTISLIDDAIELAKTSTNQIRPIKYMGEDYYVLFLHPNQIKDLRTEVSTTRITWFDTQRSLVEGGQGVKNPIFSGAHGIYNGTIIHESTRVPVSPSNAAVRRGIFAGAQAGCLCFGRGNSQNRFTWNEELFDYGNQLGVASGLVWGMKKTIYNSEDFATIVISTGAG